jgi:hypothetical protein
VMAADAEQELIAANQPRSGVQPQGTAYHRYPPRHPSFRSPSQGIVQGGAAKGCLASSAGRRHACTPIILLGFSFAELRVN